MAEVETDIMEMDVEEPLEEPGYEDIENDSKGSSVDIEAEVLFQVAHYNDEYGSPASLADIAFEIQEKDTDVHKAMEKAVEEGTPKVEPVVKSLLEQGLIVETEYGGYMTTTEGDKLIDNPEVESELGNTYESEKNKGNPEGEGIADEFGVPPDVEEDEEKSEAGVPFLTM